MQTTPGDWICEVNSSCDRNAIVVGPAMSLGLLRGTPRNAGGSDWIVPLAIALAYFVTAHWAICRIVPLGWALEPSPLWPSAGVALGSLLIFGLRYWFGVALGALWVAHSLGSSWEAAFESAIASTLAAVAGVLLLRCVGFHLKFRRLQDVFSLIVLGAMSSSLCGALLRAILRFWAGSLPGEWGRDGWTLWVGDTMGILVVTPMLLVGYTLWQERLSPARRRVLPHSVWELLLGLTLLCGVSAFVFCSQTEAAFVRYPLEYLPFPFTIWAVLRYGQLGAVLSSSLVSCIAIFGASQGRGPFVGGETPTESVLFLQAFMGVLTVTTLVLAAAVTERQEVEKLLRRQEASLANAQRIAKIGYREFDDRTRRWRWSDEMYRILGFSPQSFVPTEGAYLDAVHPDDRSRVRQWFERARRGLLGAALDYRIILPTGEERIVTEQVEVGINGITGTVQDITERKHYEAQLRASAEGDRLLGEMALRIRQSLDLNQILETTVREVRAFLQADRVLISYMGAKGKIVAESVASPYQSCLGLTFEATDYYNEIRSLFERDRVQAIADTTQIQIQSAARAKYLQDFQVKAVLGVPIWLSEPFLLKSGVWEATGCGEMQAKPEFFGLLVAHQCDRVRQWRPCEVDFLQRLATQVAIAIQQAQLYQCLQDNQASLECQVAQKTAQLQQKMQELACSNQIKNVFLDAVSHDLRTTLMGNAILLQSQLQKEGDPIAVPRCLLERMIEAGNRQLVKLNSLLEATELEVQGVRLYPKPIQGRAFVEGILEELEGLFAQNQTQMHLEMPEALPYFMGDREQLRRVFEHLIHNAIRHNPPGVELTVGAAVIEECSGCQGTSEWVRYFVRDNGVGIAPDLRDRLFDLYILDEVAPPKRLMGIRLGLYLCRQIIWAHGGQIGINTQLGEGSTVWFTLPLGVASSAYVTQQ
ncbi:MAG: GAF domain-containing protein [Desertifilum sp. SIO1I2]|nr:GAF domain-containing protein [Desertifilum sp. SIO1I2]